MAGYLGSYAHSIDDKGRLSLPAPFRRESGEQTLVLVHVRDSLRLYPESAWVEVAAMLREMMRQGGEARTYALRVTANALEVIPDKQGRILVPQRLQEAVGIDGEALAVGAIDHVELWSPDRFEAATAHPVTDEERFTQQVFG
jgi:transcriptional regulator MraZ